MIQQKEFPILEFDDDPNPIIDPFKLIKKQDVSEHCVLCFFGETLTAFLDEHGHATVSRFKAESHSFPIYEVDYKGRKVILLQAYVGAPGAAAQIEELSALGCRKFIACGGCGVLQKDIAVGNLIIPTSAVRDEGASYHYLPPSREVVGNPRAIQVIEETLREHKLPFIKGKTWTTDAFYRETPAKVQLRKDEGCITVEMETATYMAVAQYRQVEFGQILYAGDSLAGEEWDNRDWMSRSDIRELLLRLSIEACLRL